MPQCEKSPLSLRHKRRYVAPSGDDAITREAASGAASRGAFARSLSAELVMRATSLARVLCVNDRQCERAGGFGCACAIELYCEPTGGIRNTETMSDPGDFLLPYPREGRVCLFG